jgi:hypothetical protein
LTDIDSIVREIQYVVAPAVMISSAALLLLGFQTKFSNLAGRFRALNHERRELLKKHRRDATEEERYGSLGHQVAHLLARATHVKNAILLTYVSIALFLLTSVFIFFKAHGELDLSFWVLACFLSGLVLELVASVIMMVEVALAFRIVQMESGGSHEK